MAVENSMSEKKDAETYPLKSLHDFLNELDKEWDMFRTASLIGIITSGILLAFVIFRFLSLLATMRRTGAGLFMVFDDLLFIILVAAFVLYEIFLLLRQYKFFKKWERRVGLLLHLEERLMGETEGKEETRDKDLEKKEKDASQNHS